MSPSVPRSLRSHAVRSGPRAHGGRGHARACARSLACDAVVALDDGRGGGASASGGATRQPSKLLSESKRMQAAATLIVLSLLQLTIYALPQLGLSVSPIRKVLRFIPMLRSYSCQISTWIAYRKRHVYCWVSASLIMI